MAKEEFLAILGDECVCPWIFDPEYLRAIITMREEAIDLDAPISNNFALKKVQAVIPQASEEDAKNFNIASITDWK